MKILAVAGVLAVLLSACAGAYVAVDAGAHSQGNVRIGTSGSR